MAVDATLATFTKLPEAVAKASVGTNWQEFSLSKRVSVKHVTVLGSAALFVAWPDSGAADGGAAGSTANKEILAANTPTLWAMPDNPKIRAGSVFVAAQTGTATVYVTLEA